MLFSTWDCENVQLSMELRVQQILFETDAVHGQTVVIHHLAHHLYQLGVLLPSLKRMTVSSHCKKKIYGKKEFP